MFSYQLNKAVVEVNSDYGSLNSWEMITIFNNHTTFKTYTKLTVCFESIVCFVKHTKLLLKFLQISLEKWVQHFLSIILDNYCISIN